MIRLKSANRAVRAAALLCIAFLAIGARAGAADASRAVLTDGVRLIMKPELDTAVVAFTVLIRSDPDTSPAQAAVGDVVAHALFYDSLNHSFEGFAAAVAQVGGSLETERTQRYVAVTCVTVPEQWNEAVYLLCEAIKNADFAPAAIERARKEIAAERRTEGARAFQSVSGMAARRLLGLPEPSGDLVARVTQEQAVAYFTSHYVPSRTVIAAVGRFDPRRIQASFDNNLFDYERPEPRAPLLSAPVRPIETAERLTIHLATSAGYAMVAMPAPDLSSPDYAAFVVLQTLLGGGHASRLFHRIRDERGFGYSVGAGRFPDRTGPLVAYLQWDARRDKADTGEQALSMLISQFDGLVTDPPTDTEIQRGRNFAVGSYALRHERAQERSFYLSWYEACGPGYLLDSTLPDKLNAVSREDLLGAARTYLRGPRVSVVATPGTLP